MDRAFRYQTGETEEIAKELRKTGHTEVDVVKEDRIKPFLADLEGYGFFVLEDIPFDYEAISFFDSQDFVCRVHLEDRQEGKKVFIDFFSDYEEATYDPIYLG